MRCDDCIHAKHDNDKVVDCECKLDPRVPWVMYENTNCALYKKVKE